MKKFIQLLVAITFLTTPVMAMDEYSSDSEDGTAGLVLRRMKVDPADANKYHLVEVDPFEEEGGPWKAMGCGDPKRLKSRIGFGAICGASLCAAALQLTRGNVFAPLGIIFLLVGIAEGGTVGGFCGFGAHALYERYSNDPDLK